MQNFKQHKMSVMFNFLYIKLLNVVSEPRQAIQGLSHSFLLCLNCKPVVASHIDTQQLM